MYHTKKIFTQKWLKIVRSIVCLTSGWFCWSWSNTLGLGILQQWKSIVISPNSDLIISTTRATYYILFTIKSMQYSLYNVNVYFIIILFTSFLSVTLQMYVLAIPIDVDRAVCTVVSQFSLLMSIQATLTRSLHKWIANSLPMPWPAPTT